MLIASPYVLPRVALVDPFMTLTMPQEITAATGLDALTHAIEAYVSVKAQPITNALALHAIKLISGNSGPGSWDGSAHRGLFPCSPWNLQCSSPPNSDGI
jgi:alcohol dehydrogenase class IV